LPLAVNPVGVTTYWCYFLRKIVYNLLWYYNQIWYQVAALSQLSVYQISRQSDNAFTPLRKEGKKEEKKTKKLSQFLKGHISETPGAI